MNVKIEKLVYGGEGLGHHEGHTVFVPFVLPEEVVAVRALARKKKFVRGRVQHIVTPAPERAAPPCPHFTVCGGCHYQHIPYSAQLRYKAEILRETLGRLGGIQWDGPIETHGSPPLGYRNRAQWKIRPGPDGKLALGYFQAGSTALCAVNVCPILSPRLEQVLAALSSLLAADRLPRALREVEAFADSSDTCILLNAALANFTTAPAALAETLRSAVPGVETILLQDSTSERMELFGPGFLHYRVGEDTCRVGHLSFFQVNRFLIEEMAREATRESEGRLAVDLFAGVGLFTLPLARRFERVVAVESNVAAARDLAANVEAGRAAVLARTGSAEEFLRGWSDTPELVLLDPPRSGLPRAALERLRVLGPERIHYVSCDPATLARDLRGLTGEGAGARYELTEIHLFDVFPQTFHIESLVRLRRRA